MKTIPKFALIFLAVAGVVAGLVFAYLQTSAERASEAESEKPVSSVSRLQRTASGEAVLQLDKETLSRIGLKMAPLVAVRVKPEVKASARVLDPAPLIALIPEIQLAQVGLDLARNEFERLKALQQQGNASARAVQNAEAELVRAQVGRQSLQQRLLAAWGQEVAQDRDLPALAQSLAVRRAALVRADLPFGETVTQSPVGARLQIPSGTNPPIAATSLGLAPSTDPQTQGRAFLFLADSPDLAPGTALNAWLELPGEAVDGFAVPFSAVLRQAGQPCVYLQTGETNFLRRALVLEQPLPEGWFTRSLAAGDRVVVVGAQTLLSEEQKAAIRMFD